MFTKPLAAAILAAAAVLSAPAFAQTSEPVYSKQFDSCMKAIPDNIRNDDVALFNKEQACYAPEISRYKNRINSAYKKLAAHFQNDPDSLEKLDTMQKEWIKWRDMEYNFIPNTINVNGEAFTSSIQNDFMVKSLSYQASELETMLDLIAP